MEETPTTNQRVLEFHDGIVRSFIGATLVWGLLTTLAGLAVHLLLVVPQASSWFGELSELASYGRLSPIYTHLLVYAFLGNGIFAGLYYSTQRLCQARMASTLLSWLHFCSWQLIIVWSSASLKWGYTQSRTFTEMAWPVDLALGLSWICFGLNFFLTLARRRQRFLFISLWFYISTVISVGLLQLGKILVNPSLNNGDPFFAGMEDAVLQSWFGNNFATCMLTLPALGMMYYFLPKAANRPIYSHKLAILQFWFLTGFCLFAGTNDLHFTAIPEWISSLAMVFGLMLVLPSLAGFINGWKTLHGGDELPSAIDSGGKSANVELKFFTLALLFYGWSVIENGLFSIVSLQAMVNYTQWHTAVFGTRALGWCGLMLFGMIYWLMPRLFSAGIWSDRLAKAHLGMGGIGLLLILVPLYLAGAAQAFIWHSMDVTGNLRYPEFTQSFPLLKWAWWISIGGEIVYLFGLFTIVVNFFASARTNQPAQTSDFGQTVAPPAREEAGLLADDPVPPPSPLINAPVLELGLKFEQWTHLYWHRRWERLPLRMTSMIVIALAIAFFVCIAPLTLFRSTTTSIPSVKEYTPLELYGRQLYLSEGCCNCHTQMVRMLVSETKRFGEFSRAGELIYDQPAQWGQVRIGPDLARQGGRNSSFWHWTHFQNPREVTPGSVMPSYEHLYLKKIPWEKIPQEKIAGQAKSQAEFVAAEIVKQGGPPVFEGTMVFETQVVALIAYLQRLGTDLNRPVAPAPTADAGNVSAVMQEQAKKEG